MAASSDSWEPEKRARPKYEAPLGFLSLSQAGKTIGHHEALAAWMELMQSYAKVYLSTHGSHMLIDMMQIAPDILRVSVPNEEELMGKCLASLARPFRYAMQRQEHFEVTRPPRARGPLLGSCWAEQECSRKPKGLLRSSSSPLRPSTTT